MSTPGFTAEIALQRSGRTHQRRFLVGDEPGSGRPRQYQSVHPKLQW